MSFIVPPNVAIVMRVIQVIAIIVTLIQIEYNLEKLGCGFLNLVGLVEEWDEEQDEEYQEPVVPHSYEWAFASWGNHSFLRTGLLDEVIADWEIFKI